MENAFFWDVSVPLVGTDVSEERIASIIRVARTSQKTVFLIVTAVKSSNFTSHYEGVWRHGGETSVSTDLGISWNRIV
jgi:hypothetical protein